MEVRFFTLTKNTNSTKQPDLTGGTAYTCILKAASGVESPIIRLDIGQTGNPAAYNYAYIKEYGRYYFVHNWTWSGRLWEAVLNVDVLATYKSQILASSQYVLRSASVKNVRVPDTIYPMEANAQIESTSWDSPFASSAAAGEGTYILSMFGKFGSLINYALDYTTFRQLGVKLFDNAIYTAGSTSEYLEKLGTEIWQSTFNPMQYITNCVWLPFDVSTSGTFELAAGWYDLGISGGYVSPGSSHKFIIGTADLPRHPQYAATGYTWLNADPYTQYYLVCQPFGVVPIAGDRIIDATAISAEVDVDEITGKACLQIKDGGGNIITQTGAQLGVPVSIAQSTVDFSGIVSNLSTAVGGAVSAAGGNIITGTADVIGGAVGSFISAVSPNLSISGTQGAALKLGDSWTLYAVTHRLGTRAPERYGEPFAGYTALSGLSGYTQCANAAIDLPGTDTEIDVVTSYLNGGFYIE